MSTQRGNAKRTRAQKHKNSHAFKNDMHDKTPQQKMLNSLNITEVCQHCKGVLEWKIKYKKYKPLSKPKTCTQCQQRNIIKAYHVLCRDCAKNSHVCPKCLKSADEVEIEPEPISELEIIKLRAEVTKLVKTLPERKRRAFWRFMEAGKKVEEEVEEGEEEAAVDDASDNEIVQEKPTIPYTRDELLEKIEQLKLSCRNKDDEDDFLFDSDCDSESDCSN